VNGVRSASSKQPYRANLFQPATFLDMVVYHNERSNLQRIKEFKWLVIYNDIYRNVHKNTVALFMTEVLQKCLNEPEPNPDLFAFLEDVYAELDNAVPQVTANYPLYFLLHLAHFFGYRIQDNYNDRNQVLDLHEGKFTSARPVHPNYLEGAASELIAELLRSLQPRELEDLSMTREQRRSLLEALVVFYSIHQAGFGTLKSVPVLHALYD
jgi:DNA repair protein RecO (recombination protein O)